MWSTIARTKIPIEDFDYWITDKEPDPDLIEALKDKVTILYDGKDSDYE